MTRFRMTTDHPASNYGLPVIVDPDGNAYGPADQLPWIDGEGANPGHHPMLGGMTGAWLARQWIDDPDATAELRESAALFLRQMPNAR